MRSVPLKRHSERFSQRRRSLMSKQKHHVHSSLRMDNFLQRVSRHARQSDSVVSLCIYSLLHARVIPLAYTVVITAMLYLASLALVGGAYATTSSPQVIVEHVTDLGVFNGQHYLQVEGLMVGTFPRPGSEIPGSYRVPLIMAFPVGNIDDHDHAGRPGNGVGLVDVPNSAAFEVTPGPTLTEEDIFQLGIIAMGDYLFREGYTYLSVQWSQTVTKSLGADPPSGRRRLLGYGVIEDASDKTQILRDASHLLRHPIFLQDIGTLKPVEHVLALGYSQTGREVSNFIRAGSNQQADGLSYDGFAIVANIAPSSRPFPQGQGKIISLYTETDLVFFPFRGHRDRASTALEDYRHYELAGVAHIPQPINPLDALGATRQNPADFAPVLRAIIANLVAWIRHGDSPPPSRFIEGTILPNGGFVPERDADGNALGGLRLPHMPSVLCDESSDEDDCRAAGAPLGTYTGLEPNFPVPPFTNLSVHLGGTFESFSPQQLTERYRNQGHYVTLVRRAAQALRKQGYILQEDYRTYVREAAQQPLR